jgi:hypothetical protein
MKRILYVFALLVASTFAAEAQQRVEISTARMPKGDHIKFVSPLDKSIFAPAALGTVNNGKSLLPDYLLAEPVEVGFLTAQDTSDTAFILTSKVDATKRTLTGIYDFPLDLIQAVGYNILSPAQFVAGLNGELVMDTVAFSMFKLPASPTLKNDMLLFVVKTNVDMNAANYNGLRVNFEDLEILGDPNGYTISADTVNNRFDEAASTLRRVIIPLENITIPAGTSFGFVVYPLDDAPEEFRMYGVREWGMQPKETGGAMLRRTPNGRDTINTMWSALSYTNSVLPDYPSLANKGLAINYDFFIGGTFDAQTSVTPTAPAAGFTLEQNQPNPVNGTTAINFSVSEYSPVTLRVYNSLGQQIAELANGNLEPNTYKADFNTANLPAGTYMYVLNANGRTISRTMQVIR